MMAPPFFPIDAGGLQREWSFRALDEGSFEAEGFTVLAREIPHTGGRTFGFRVSDGASSIAYVLRPRPARPRPFGPDGWGPYHAAVRELAEGVDVLLHDAQFTAGELAVRPHFGHSAIDYAVALAERCHVGRLLLHHHDPERTDDEVDALVEAHQGSTVKWRRRSKATSSSSDPLVMLPASAGRRGGLGAVAGVLVGRLDERFRRRGSDHATPSRAAPPRRAAEAAR